MAEVGAGSEPPQTKRSSLDNYYADTYGDQAATVASVVALASHAELFDRDTSDEEIVESYFLRVPDSTLIVNRRDTNAEYGLSKSFMVLDGEEPLFQLDGGRLAFNNLTPGQAAALERGLLEVASPLLLHEHFFQLDVAQGLSNEGEAQARTILSQGDALTLAMVFELNDLMAAEEDLRRQDQATRGLVGEVRYPRFTEYELNQNLSMDTIARQLMAQSPVVEVRVVEQSFQEANQQSVDPVTQVPPTNIDQVRSQAEVQEPPVAGYASALQTQQLQPEANIMVAVQERVETEIDLRDLMSQKMLGIMEGKVPQKRVEVEGKPQLMNRTPEEGFAMVARSAYGAQNFCQENNLPHTPATEVIATAADRLSLNGAAVTGVLESLDKAKCRPSIEAATGSQAGVWARIEEKYPEYAAKVPAAMKTERAAAQAAVAPPKAAVAAATTRQVERPVLKQRATEQQLPSQFEMAVVVAAYRLQEAKVDRWGHDNDKATLIFNRSQEGNVTVVNKADNAVVATRNGVTGEVIPGVLPAGQDYSQAYKAVLQQQTEKYVAKTAVAAPKAKVAAGDGR